MMLAFDDEGSGPAVLLIHSGVCDRRMWRAQVEALAADHRVVAADLRGFGETPLPPGPFSFAEDVVALLDDLGIASCTWVGSSFGGRVALEAATAYPERVDSLVLLCPAYRGIASTPDAEAFDAQEDRLLDEGDIDAAVELNVATWLGPEATEECRALVREMQRHALEVQLAAEAASPAPEPIPVEVDPARIVVPTLVVSGGRDMDLFGQIARHLATAMPAARHHHLPWAAHLPSLERPAEVNDLVQGFLPGGAASRR
jgi:3-oxoadipate enol-lactonase